MQLKMASILDKNKSVIESRMSYYMLQEEKQKTLNKNTLLHRLISVSRISPDLHNKQRIENYFETILDRLQRKNHAEMSTGNLLIYPNHVLIILESSYEVVTTVIRNMRKEAMSGQTELFSDTKIINIDHDIQPRLFKTWTCRYLNVPRHIGDAPTDVDTEGVATEIISAILKIGYLLMKQPRLDNPNDFESGCSDLLPPSGQLEAMLASKLLMTCDQYLDLYTRPMDYLLDGEKLWPLDQDVVGTIVGEQK